MPLREITQLVTGFRAIRLARIPVHRIVTHLFHAPEGLWNADPGTFVPMVLAVAVLALAAAGYSIFRSQRRIGQVQAEEQEILRSNRQLQFLNAISKVAAQSFDIQEILQNAVEQLLGLFSADTGGVWLLEEDGKTVRRRAATGVVASELSQFEVPEEFLKMVR